MRVAVINETSAAHRNIDIMNALKGRGHEIINAGMRKQGEQPELQYIHTGLISAILLNLKRVDLAIGGCGTGQGYLNSVMQYPGVFCGLIRSPLDAWLFTQINNGNCVSLGLNQGYGWAEDVNIGFIFDRLFSVEVGAGYPSHRKEPQAASRQTLQDVSVVVHRPMAEIIRTLPEYVIRPALDYPGILELIDVNGIEDVGLRSAFQSRLPPE